MSHMPLISVIVPIYQVEAYLEECIDSILNQTYRQLEIILVDDGSFDRCGEICDRYALQDPRIQVIHQTNMGLSAARNAGLDIATGSYISFIDNDDYIDPQFYEKLLNGFKEHPEVKVTACQIFKVQEGSITPLNSKWHLQQPTVYSNLWCQASILGKYCNVTVWDKLYQAQLLKDIRFRQGRLVEDVLFMYDFQPIVNLHQAQLLVLSEYLYYYRIRQGSICHNTEPIIMEHIRCLKEISKESYAINPFFSKQVILKMNKQIISFCAQMELNKEWKRKYVSTFHPLLKKIPISEIMRYKLSLIRKTSFFIIRIYPSAYPFFRKIKRALFAPFVR